MGNKMKITVDLEYDRAKNLSEWKEKWKQGLANDEYPYGYNLAATNECTVKYMAFTRNEKRFLINNIIGKIYFRYLKEPKAFLSNDFIWIHSDDDILKLAKWKRMPIVGKRMAKVLAVCIWLTDKYVNFTQEEIDMWKNALKRIDKIVVYSRAQEKILEEVFGCEKEKIHFVKFGINVDAYSSSKSIHMPDKMKDWKDEKYILFVGSDMHRDADAVTSIVKNTNYKYVIATRNEQLLKLDYLDNVKTMFCDFNEIKWLYRNCEFLILPLKNNRHCSGITTLLETAALKKAAIISDIPSIDDYLIDGKTAIKVPIGDNDKFIEAIKYLDEHPDECEKIGKSAFEFVKNSEYTTQAMASTYYKISRGCMK